MRLTRTQDGSSRRLPDIHVRNEGPLNGVRMGPIWGEPDCSMIFQHVDLHFKKAVGMLVVAVEDEIRAWPKDHSTRYVPAASSAAMSSLFMLSIACTAFGPFSSWGMARGMICQDTPNLSLHQPQRPSLPPSAVSFSQ